MENKEINKRIKQLPYTKRILIQSWQTNNLIVYGIGIFTVLFFMFFYFLVLPPTIVGFVGIVGAIYVMIMIHRAIDKSKKDLEEFLRENSKSSLEQMKGGQKQDGRKKL